MDRREGPPKIDRRNPPILTPIEKSHTYWLLTGIILVLTIFLLFVVQDQLSPLLLASAIFVLVYPFRSLIELRPLLVIVGLVILLAIWQRFHSLLLPFIIAFIIAYSLNPGVEWLVGKKWPKPLVILVIVTIILSGMVGIGLLIVPRLVQEVADLAANVPHWVDKIEDWTKLSFLPWLSQRIDIPVEDLIERLQTGVADKTEEVFTSFGQWSVRALGGIVTLITSLFNIILIPILTIYYLNEMENRRKKLFSIVPEMYKSLAQDFYVGINRVLGGYLRGQVLVILFLSTWIGLGLWLIAGVPYALLLGITAGCLNLLPYIGASTALLLTIIVSSFQPDPLATTVKALIVFLSAQILESNVITPRLVGDRVGLHPIAVIFLVLLFATLFGIIGMLLAIPVGAVGLVCFKAYMAYRKARPIRVVNPEGEKIINHDRRAKS